jgi:hypothetical protein
MTEAVDAQESASVRLQYLDYNEKISKDNHDVPLNRQNIKGLVANLRVDKQGNLVGHEIDLTQVPAESQPILANVHEALEQALEGMAVPLPNRQIAPGESWRAERTLRIPSLGGAVAIHLDMTYTYAGTRHRTGHQEAVLNLQGEIRAIGNQAGRATGHADGTANVDLRSGQVTQADMVLVFDLEMNPLSRSLPSGGKLTLRLQRDMPTGN